MGSEDDDERKFGVSRRIMVAAIGSLVGVVIIIILLHLYARYLLKRQERRRRAAQLQLYSQRSSQNQIAPIDESSSWTEGGGAVLVPTAKSSSGLDPSVIAMLPTFTYKPTTTTSEQQQQVAEDEPTECSVCLGSITEESRVRLLPNCKHMFHVECIDTWLASNTTCPICRTPADPKLQPDHQLIKDKGTTTTMSILQPTAPPLEENVAVAVAQVEKEGGSSSSSSGSRFGSFRRMLGRERSSRRIIQSCGDHEVICTQDLERQ